mgnify:CR=1 FL=1
MIVIDLDRKKRRGNHFAATEFQLQPETEFSFSRYPTVLEDRAQRFATPGAGRSP